MWYYRVYRLKQTLSTNLPIPTSPALTAHHWAKEMNSGKATDQAICSAVLIFALKTLHNVF
jgi:hypothetical protein